MNKCVICNEHDAMRHSSICWQCFQDWLKREETLEPYRHVRRMWTLANSPQPDDDPHWHKHGAEQNGLQLWVIDETPAPVCVEAEPEPGITTAADADDPPGIVAGVGG